VLLPQFARSNRNWYTKIPAFSGTAFGISSVHAKSKDQMEAHDHNDFACLLLLPQQDHFC
jgi:hypothetical protein